MACSFWLFLFVCCCCSAVLMEGMIGCDAFEFILCAITGGGATFSLCCECLPQVLLVGICCVVPFAVGSIFRMGLAFACGVRIAGLALFGGIPLFCIWAVASGLAGFGLFNCFVRCL